MGGGGSGTVDVEGVGEVGAMDARRDGEAVGVAGVGEGGGEVVAVADDGIVADGEGGATVRGTIAEWTVDIGWWVERLGDFREGGGRYAGELQTQEVVIEGRVDDGGRSEVEALIGVVTGHDGQGVVEVALAE